MPSQAALIDLASAPLVVSSNNVVKPNLLFVLDDSGSMSWDYMPDYTRDRFCRSKGAGIDSGTNYSGTFSANCCANNDTGSSNVGTGLGGCTAGTSPNFGGWRGQPLFMAADFSGMAYNPNIRYRPPVKADGTEDPSYSSGWTAVPDDAYGIQKSLTTTTNLLSGYPDTEWCPTAASPSSDCLRNGNYILPGIVGGTSYTVFRAGVRNRHGQDRHGLPHRSNQSGPRLRSALLPNRSQRVLHGTQFTQLCAHANRPRTRGLRPFVGATAKPMPVR